MPLIFEKVDPCIAIENFLFSLQPKSKFPSNTHLFEIFMSWKIVDQKTCKRLVNNKHNFGCTVITNEWSYRMSMTDVILAYEVSDMDFCKSTANSYKSTAKVVTQTLGSCNTEYRIVGHMSIKPAMSKHITAIWISGNQTDRQELIISMIL